MDCKTSGRLLELYLDGELSREDARELEAHVDTCATCRDALTALGHVRHMLRDELPRVSAPDTLRARIAATARASATSAASASTRRPTWWPSLVAASLCAFVLGAALGRGWLTAADDGRDRLAHDLFASHWRALAAASPVDVVSSDRHTVKPWFAGKLAAAPPVQDFAEQGFALVGGRLDYAGAQRTPVLVYRHGAHLIDVFVLAPGSELARAGEMQQGYSLLPTTLAGQPGAVVSDLDAQELQRFERLLEGVR